MFDWNSFTIILFQLILFTTNEMENKFTYLDIYFLCMEESQYDFLSIFPRRTPSPS